MRTVRARVAMVLIVGGAALVPAGIAHADCTAAGDFGAAAGCAPPGGSSGGGDSWPPTGVDWPPNGDSGDSGSGDDGGSSGGGGGKAKPPTPIVMPAGESAPVVDTSSTSDPSSAPQPIVPVDAPPAR